MTRIEKKSSTINHAPDKQTLRFSAIVWMYAAAIAGCFPLWIDDYTNVGQTKFFCFVVLNIFCLLWCILEVGTGTRPWEHRLKEITMHWEGRFFGVFLLLNVIALIGSLNRHNSLWGLGAYFGGFVMLLTGAFTYFIIRLFLSRSAVSVLLKVISASTVLVVALYACHLMGVDPLHIQGSVVQNSAFLSTIGHIDFTGSYMAMMLPVTCVMFTVAEEKKDVIWYGICAVLLTAAVPMVDSDGILLGMAAAVLVVICRKDFTWKRLIRILIFLNTLCMWAAYLTGLAKKKSLVAQLPFASHAGKFMMVMILLLAAAVLVEVYGKKSTIARSEGATGSKQKEQSSNWYGLIDSKLYLAGRVLTAIACVSIIVLFVIVNRGSGKVQLSDGLRNFFVLGPDWGTRRGICWIELAGIWKRSPVGRKLFGYGVGMTNTVLRNLSSIQDGYLFGFYAAHNEFLEELISTGLLGMIAWAGVVGSTIVRALLGGYHTMPVAGTVTGGKSEVESGIKERFRVNPVNKETLAVAAGVIGYVAQSLISIRVSAVFPIFVTLLAVLSVTCSESESDAPEKQKYHAQKPAEIVKQWGKLLVGAIVLTYVAGRLGQILFHMFF